jgi:opacity protein-like surface antigen
MKRVLAVSAIAVSLSLIALAAAAPPLPGKRIARATGSGAFAIAVAHGQVTTPKALYAKLTGKVGDATVLVDCIEGLEPTPITYARPRAGLFRFAVKPEGADICHVTATVSGRGKIVAELRAVR